MPAGFITPVVFVAPAAGPSGAHALAPAAGPLAILSDTARFARPLVVVAPGVEAPQDSVLAEAEVLRLPRELGSAAMVGLAALRIAQQDPEGRLVVLRGARSVAGELLMALDRAAQAAERGWLARIATRGAPAAGGFGVVALGPSMEDGETPLWDALETAHDTGLLVCRAGTLIGLIEAVAPGLVTACRALLAAARPFDGGLELPGSELPEVSAERIEDLLARTTGRVGVVLADADRPIAAAPSPVPGASEEVVRPWGSYRSVLGGDGFQVKQLTVTPDAVLSLQSHRHRAEHWTVVQGEAEVTCDGRVFILKPNQSTYIPLGAIHRLANRGSELLRVVEVQCGDYLGEDDIERYEDIYGRVEARPADADRGSPDVQATA